NLSCYVRFCFSSARAHREPLSFPTRRSSDLPEPLKAVVTVCSTDDRYDNDVHYIGGSVLGIDMAGWSGTMLAFTARPPDPARVRSEGHTSEPQSRENLVCRLLLEKKNLW